MVEVIKKIAIDGIAYDVAGGGSTPAGEIDAKDVSFTAEMSSLVSDNVADALEEIAENSTLESLTDTSIQTPEQGEVVMFDSTTNKWHNTPLTTLNEGEPTVDGEYVGQMYKDINTNKIYVRGGKSWEIIVGEQELQQIWGTYIIPNGTTNRTSVFTKGEKNFSTFYDMGSGSGSVVNLKSGIEGILSSHSKEIQTIYYTKVKTPSEITIAKTNLGKQKLNSKAFYSFCLYLNTQASDTTLFNNVMYNTDGTFSYFNGDFTNFIRAGAVDCFEDGGKNYSLCIEDRNLNLYEITSTGGVFVKTLKTISSTNWSVLGNIAIEGYYTTISSGSKYYFVLNIYRVSGGELVQTYNYTSETLSFRVGGTHFAPTIIYNIEQNKYIVGIGGQTTSSNGENYQNWSLFDGNNDTLIETIRQGDMGQDRDHSTTNGVYITRDNTVVIGRNSTGGTTYNRARFDSNIPVEEVTGTPTIAFGNENINSIALENKGLTCDFKEFSVGFNGQNKYISNTKVYTINDFTREGDGKIVQYYQDGVSLFYIHVDDLPEGFQKLLKYKVINESLKVDKLLTLNKKYYTSRFTETNNTLILKAKYYVPGIYSFIGTNVDFIIPSE